MSDVTQILQQIESGDPSASEELLPLVYEELRKLAAARMADERSDHTLQATALVHEAYVRLVDTDRAQHWNSRGHFFGAAAEAMQRLLVEHARERQSAKRGHGWARIELTGLAAAAASQPDRLLDLNEALRTLSGEDDQAARIAKLRLFAGMTLEEISLATGLSTAAVHRHWTYARARLKQTMGDD